MDRRTFFKVGGAIAATGLLGSCGQAAQKIIPYVTPPDEGINPVQGWYFATACRVCEAGCGIMVRTVEGRAKKIEGLADHPVNGGAVCARGQAAVQQLYHPERIKQPLKRTGPKGTNNFKPIRWDEAINIFADNIRKAKDGGLFVMANDDSDITAAVASRLLKAVMKDADSQDIYMDNFCVPNMNGESVFTEAAEPFRNKASLPYHDISRSSYVLLLGADILENGFSPVHYGTMYGKMRRESPMRRGFMTYAGPRMSMTAAVSDHFIGTPPGVLGILALGVAAVALEALEELDAAEKENLLSTIPYETLEEWNLALADYTPEKAAARTQVPAKQIREMGEKFVKEAPAVAIAGAEVYAQSNGLESAKAVEFLNLVSREVARARRTLKPDRLPKADREMYAGLKEFIGAPANARNFSTYENIVAKAAAGGVKLGIIINADPVHSMPGYLKTGKALSKVGFVAAFGNFLNDTTQYADIVFPDHHFLEAWSAKVVDYPHGTPIVNLQQPVINPMYDTRPAADVIIAASQKAGVDFSASFGGTFGMEEGGAKSAEEIVKAMIKRFRGAWNVPEELEDEKAWEHLLRKGGWWPREMQSEVEPAPDAGKLAAITGHLKVSDPLFDTSRGFNLVPHVTANMWDGRMANLSWMQEMPEPMTTVMWSSWVEFNPKTAKKLGIKEGDIIRVESSAGFIEAPAFIYPGIGPDTVAVPFGYGHKSYGKNATGRGANAMNLIGGTSWRGIKVKITKTGAFKKFARAAHPEGEYVPSVFQL